MDQQRFDIYLTGKLAPGLDAGDAAQRLAQLFRTPVETTRGLISGRPQLLKRGVDRATALKYREALGRAGLEIAVRAAAGGGPASPPAPPPPTQSPAAAADTAGLSLAPAGSDVLTPAERAPSVTVNIDTDGLALAPVQFAAPEPTAAAPIDAPDFTLAPTGDLLRPEEKRPDPPAVPLPPDLSLAEPGAVLDTLPVGVAAVDPDTSALTLAPAGGPLLAPAERRETPPIPVPDISHLRLDE